MWGSSPALLKSKRRTRTLGVLTIPCLPVSMRGVLLSSIMTIFQEWGLEREPGLTPDCCGSSQELVPISYHTLLPMTAMVAVGGCFSLAEVRLVSPQLGMSSGCLPGKISVLGEFILCVISIFLFPFDVLWGTAGNMSLFLQLLTKQVFQGACFPALGLITLRHEL